MNHTTAPNWRSRKVGGLSLALLLPLLILFLVSGIFYMVAWPSAPHIANDSHSYFRVADDLQDLRLSSFHDRSIGYPLVLLATGAIGEPNRTLFVMQLIFHMVAVFCLALALYRLSVPAPAVITFAVLGVMPLSVQNTAFVLSETTSTLVLALGILLLVLWLLTGKLWLVLLCGALLSFSAIVRPVNQLLVPVFVVILLTSSRFEGLRGLRRQIAIGSGVLTAMWLLIVGGNLAYNNAAFGHASLTPLLGFNLTNRTAPFVERLPDEYADVREVIIRYRDEKLVEPGSSHTGYQYIWAAEPELVRLTGLTKLELSDYLVELNLLLIRQAPLTYLAEVAQSSGLYWMPHITRDAFFDLRPLQMLWAVLHFVLLGLFVPGIGVLMSVGLLGLLLPTQARRQMVARLTVPHWQVRGVVAALIVVGLILYTMVISVMLEVGDPRQRSSTDLMNLFVTVLALHTIWRLRADLITLLPVAHRSPAVSDRSDNVTGS
jgi:hypothetical protein